MEITSFKKDFENFIRSDGFDNIFDMSAWCFCHYKCVLHEKSITEPIFIGLYFDMTKKGLEGPNKDNLLLLSQVQVQLIDIFTNPDPNKDWLTDMLVVINQVELNEFHDAVLLEETIACTIITALDISLSPEHDTMEDGEYKEQISRENRRYPLNSKFTDQVRIFSRFRGAMHELDKQGLNFPQSGILRRTISNQLCNIFFLEESVISHLHKIQLIKTPSGHLYPNENRLRIAISPFTNEKVTEVVKREEGGCFRIEHSKEYDETYGEVAIKILEQSMSKKANILIFPEYMMTESIENKIVRYLIDHRGDNTGLLFVVAGSQWVTEEGGKKTNNVSSVYYYNGMRLGKIYKSSEYAAYEVGLPIDQSSEYYTERLSNPGKEILVLDVPQIGRFAFAICRDVCDESCDTLTDKIVNVFRPDFLIVPAWSTSIMRGFKSKFKKYAAQGVISILCNCCEPIDTNPKLPDAGKKEDVRTLIGSPSKPNEHGKNIDGNTIQRQCPKTIHNSICDPKHCLFLVDIVPSRANLIKGNICEQWQHIDFQGEPIK